LSVFAPQSPPDLQFCKTIPPHKTITLSKTQFRLKYARNEVLLAFRH
jgi:hypothetical protein